LSDLTQSEKKLLRSLLTKKGRAARHQFTAEGIRLLEESINHHCLPQKIFAVPDEISSRSKSLLQKFTKLKIPITKISAHEMAQITDTDTSQGMLGLFDSNLINIGFDEIISMNSSATLLLDNISDPGNAGTLFRSALAFGFETVFATESTVDFFNPKLVRSTAGAIFGLKVAEVTMEQLARIKKMKWIMLIAADIKGMSIHEGLKKYDSADPVILAIGAEAEGLSEKIINLSDIRIRIEHSREVESLNAAVAGSIIMREIYLNRIGDRRL